MPADVFKKCADNGDTLGAILAVKDMPLEYPYILLEHATPLVYAVKCGDIGLVTALIELGSQINILDDDELSALCHASMSGNIEICELLIESGADIENVSLSQTPLHRAAYYNQIDVVQLLLNAGAKVNTQDISGYTALHLAASKGHTDVVELLVKSGANTEIEDKNGQLAYHLAVDNQNFLTSDFLRYL